MAKPPVFVSGGKRLNFDRRDEYTDEIREEFSGYGKDTGCYPSGSWAELCALAKLITEHPAYTPVPPVTPYYRPTIEDELEPGIPAPHIHEGARDTL